MTETLRSTCGCKFIRIKLTPDCVERRETHAGAQKEAGSVKIKWTSTCVRGVKNELFQATVAEVVEKDPAKGENIVLREALRCTSGAHCVARPEMHAGFGEGQGKRVYGGL